MPSPPTSSDEEESLCSSNSSSSSSPSTSRSTNKVHRFSHGRQTANRKHPPLYNPFDCPLAVDPLAKTSCCHVPRYRITVATPRKELNMRRSLLSTIEAIIRLNDEDGQTGWIELNQAMLALKIRDRTGLLGRMKSGRENERICIMLLGMLMPCSLRQRGLTRMLTETIHRYSRRDITMVVHIQDELCIVGGRYRQSKSLRSKLSRTEAKAQVQFFARLDEDSASQVWADLREISFAVSIVLIVRFRQVGRWT